MKKLDVPIDKYNWHLVVLIDVDIDNISISSPFPTNIIN